MDLDCLGSLILIKKIYSGYRLVRSSQIHPAARNLYNYYEALFDFISPKDLVKEHIDNIIIVDTCMAERVKEYFGYIHKSTPEIRIIDHHPTENCNILGAAIDKGCAGANTSLVGKLAIACGINLSAEEATIALTGIYADTGRLIFENVTRTDYEVAAWLIEMGASLKLVRSFLETVMEDDQIEVLNRIMMNKSAEVIQGHSILFSYLELDENINGLAAVVEKINEIENPDAYFAVFYLVKTKTVLLIARSRKEKIDLHYLLHAYGGGGHQAAASAKISDCDGISFLGRLKVHLENSLAPAVRARDIMTKKVYYINEKKTLLEASMYLEEVNHSGAPVLNEAGEITGFIDLKDIMKGRRASVMQSPVTAYMSKPVITAEGSVTMREVERLFYRHHIGHLPVTEDSKLAGIITRNDYLEYQIRRND